MALQLANFASGARANNAQMTTIAGKMSDAEMKAVADYAAGAGFEALEIACWPQAGGEKRRYAGTAHLPIEDMTAARGSEIMGMLKAKGLSVSGLGYYPNPLHADAGHREAVIGHLKKVITAASLMGVKVVNSFVGGDRTLTVDQNWARATEIFAPIVAHAKASGVTLAFENCPMIFSHDEWPGGHNIAYAPRIWRRINACCGWSSRPG